MRKSSTLARAVQAAALGLLLAGCAGQAPTPPAAAYTECTEPRPEICTFDYRPVCGIRSDRVRCVKEPCHGAMPRTYGNACTACADPAVSRHSPGECAGASES